MTDLLRVLPRLSWRGIEVPCTSRSVTFEHDGVVHAFAFRDKQLVESQGIRNYRFKYTIPFREDATRAPYKNLFTRVYHDFVNACRDRSEGVLFDPVLGQFTAKVLTFTDTADVAARDGVDVDVEFIESPPATDAADVNLPPQVVGAADGRAFDAEIEKVDWKQEPPPESTVDVFAAIDGVGRQIEANGAKLGAAFEKVAFRMTAIEKTLDRLSDPTTWPLRQSVRRARHDVVAASKGIAASVNRIVIAHTTLNQDMPLTVLAKDVKMDVQALVQINQNLARMVMVPKGTRVRYLRRQ